MKKTILVAVVAAFAMGNAFAQSAPQKPTTEATTDSTATTEAEGTPAAATDVQVNVPVSGIGKTAKSKALIIGGAGAAGVVAVSSASGSEKKAPPAPPAKPKPSSP